MNVCSSSKLDE